MMRTAPLALVATLLAPLTLSPVTAQAAEAGANTAASRYVSLVRTDQPGGMFGYWGFDLYTDQKVGARFEVPTGADVRLARVGLWLMNNSGSFQGRVTVSVQTDALDEGGSQSLPSGSTLGRWTAKVDTLGWTPVKQFFTSASKPWLQAGRRYWVVAESAAPALQNPVWVTAASGSLFSTTTSQGAWQTGGDGAAPGLIVDGIAGE